MRRLNLAALCAFAGTLRLFAADPAPTQTTSADGNPYHSPIPVNSPFPDNYYGADHGGSSLSLIYPYAGPFGLADHSRGQFVYQVAAFTPRSSEGVFGMDVWLEQQDGSGNWSPAGVNGGAPDQGYVYQPVNTPNPGPSPTYAFTWTFNPGQLPPNTAFRVFVYVYIYNQGGGTQGDFPVASSTAAVGTGSANDAPRIAWTASAGNANPAQVQAGQTYTISADAQDDNGNLVAVSINKNGQPFAYAGGGSGYAGNSQNPASDPIGTETYTAWATDSRGAQSPTITRTVVVAGKSSQPSVSSTSATIPFGQGFSPQCAGGAGSGGWQFCIIGYTNWDAGTSAYAGTNLGPSPGNSPGADWVAQWTPPASGAYSFYIARDGDGSYAPSAIAGPYTLTVSPPLPPGVSLSANPSSGNAPLTATIAWTTTLATAVTVSGQGVAGAALSGSQGTTLTAPGTYAYALTATGPGGVSTREAVVTVSAPLYTLTTAAVGNGTVTPGGTYPANTVVVVDATPGANAVFSGWTGSLASSENPLPVTMNGNLALYANFSALRTQTISFAPPATANFPGAAIALAATASSGLPVGLAVISGPGVLAGSQLTLTGIGNVVVQASQGGNSQWLPAATVTAVVAANSLLPIARVRFNATGRDARVSGGYSAGGTSVLWTDPSGLQNSPWPTFANPAPAAVAAAAVLLPEVAHAPPLAK